MLKTVDTKNNKLPINVSDSGPIEETYFLKIVDEIFPNIINDTRNNGITSKLSITDKLSIGSYIGVPITLSTGEIYATFCRYKLSPGNTLNYRVLFFLNAITDIATELIEKNVKTRFDYNEIKTRNVSVLDHIEIDVYYQPITNLNSDKITAYESLPRFNSTPYK